MDKDKKLVPVVSTIKKVVNEARKREKLMVKDRKTGKTYDPHKELNKLLHHPKTVAQFKRMKDEKGLGWPKNKDF